MSEGCKKSASEKRSLNPIFPKMSKSSHFSTPSVAKNGQLNDQNPTSPLVGHPSVRFLKLWFLVVLALLLASSHTKLKIRELRFRSDSHTPKMGILKIIVAPPPNFNILENAVKLHFESISDDMCLC